MADPIQGRRAARARPDLVALLLACSLHSSASSARQNPPAPSSPSVSTAAPTPLPIPASLPASIPPASDTLPIPATLADSVRYALQHNPQVRVAAAERAMAMAKLIPDQPGFRPNVQATANETVEGPTVRLPIPQRPNIVVPSESHQLALTADQVVFHAGRSANQRRLAAESASAQAAYSTAVQGVIHDVSTAYVQVLQAQESERIASDAVGAVQASVGTVQTLIQAGRAVQLDLLNAQSSLAEVQQDETMAAAGLAVARANYNRTLGRPLNAPVDLAGLAAGPETPASADDAVRQALELRPDLRQREADLAAARAAVALARLQGGPTVTARTGLSLQNPTALRSTTDWSLGASVSIPLLQSAQQRADAAQAAAGVQAAEAGLEAARQGDSLLALRAWQDYQSARSAETADAAAVAAQQEGFRAVGLKRQVNQATEADVAQARLKLEQAQSTAVRHHYDTWLRGLDLEYETGQIESLAAGSAGAPAREAGS